MDVMGLYRCSSARHHALTHMLVRPRNKGQSALVAIHSPMSLRIETERLILTPEEPSDADWFTELLNARGMDTFTVADALERIDVMTKTIETTGIGVLVLRRRLDGTAVGYTAIVVGRCSLDEPELVYELLPRAYGHGYATEAARALLDAAFDTGRRRISATRDLVQRSVTADRRDQNCRSSRNASTARPRGNARGRLSLT